MKLIKHTIKILVIFSIIVICTTLIYTLLLYNNIIPNNNSNINLYSFVIGIVLFMILGLISSTNASKKGWLIGLLYGLLVVSVVVIIKTFSNDPINLLSIAKYIIYLLSSCLGGIIGINLKKGL